jgi:hypothetical protein
MSERLGLHRKGQESTSHQATLVIGGINLINTRIWATCKEAKHGDQRKCPKARLRQRERKAESKGGGHKTTGRAKNKPKERESRENTGARQGKCSGSMGCK